MVTPPQTFLALLLGSGTTLTGACLAAAPTGADEADISDTDFLARVQDGAIELDTLDWRGVDLSRLSVLDKLLGNKLIVYLGEPDHYVREKYDFQLIFIRYLFERGWRHVGMAMGRADGQRIDRYLETGDIAWLDRVAS